MEAWFRGSITFCHIARNFAWDVSRFWRPSYSILLSQNAIKRVGCINDRSIVFQFIRKLNEFDANINRFFHFVQKEFWNFSTIYIISFAFWQNFRESIFLLNTVKPLLRAAALILSKPSDVRLLFEGGSYSIAALV